MGRKLPPNCHRIDLCCGKWFGTREFSRRGYAVLVVGAFSVVHTAWPRRLNGKRPTTALSATAACPHDVVTRQETGKSQLRRPIERAKNKNTSPSCRNLRYFFSGGLTTVSAGATIGLMGHRKERTLGPHCRLARQPAATPDRWASTAAYTDRINRIAEKAAKRLKTLTAQQTQLRGVRQINVVATMLLVAGLLALFGGVAIAVVFDSEILFWAFFTIGWTSVGACLLLSFVVDRVRCPKCGKPFNRPDYQNWIARNFSKTRPHWSCVHCGHGRRNG